MTEGLLFVLAEPGRVGEDDFHDWYDNEHAPKRLTVPGIHTGYRYRALDGRQPTWLAWYELDLAALDSPEYRAARERSPREQKVVKRLATLDRRVYAQIDDHDSPLTRPARRSPYGNERTAHPAPWTLTKVPLVHPAAGEPPVVVAVALSTRDEDGLDAWYRDEHIPLLHTMPGWRRTRRYRRVDGPGLLAFHEIDSVDLFDEPAYREATTTPWRARVMADVTARERRVFAHHNTVG